jgi:serine/threonine protein kinase
MGAVFLADDTSLNRKVALKFLPPELQQDAVSRRRFLREARSAAALDNPYICSIHEVGAYEGRDFIVMEYIDGQTLMEKISRRRLPLNQALTIAIEITRSDIRRVSALRKIARGRWGKAAFCARHRN